MSYRYRYSQHYETANEIEQRFSKLPRCSARIASGDDPAKRKALQAASHREEFLEWLDMKERLAAQVITFPNIDVNNIYSVEAALSYLQGIYEELKSTEFVIGFDPYYEQIKGFNTTFEDIVAEKVLAGMDIDDDEDEDEDDRREREEERELEEFSRRMDRYVAEAKLEYGKQ